jgi:isopentenyl diphosphate isomerase/L-lactate dehydrogenase-like FMN-dependent dehydrogenase
MTKYHKIHPGFGGPSIIIKNAGADATQGFRKAKHSPKAQEIQGGLLIGELERNVKSELAKVMNLDDMKKRAIEVLSPGAEAYYNAGAEDGTSMTEALEVWDRDWRLRPRNFIDVSNVDMSQTVLGHKIDFPAMAAPTALLKMGHEDGEAAVARGCQMTGIGNCLSTTASLSIEDVAAASPDCYRWFQLYVYKDHEKTKNLVLRAKEAGYSAICLTVDLPVLGNRTSLKRIGFRVPKEFTMANMASEKKTDAEKKIEEETTKAGAGKKDTSVNIKEAGDRAAYVNKLYDQSLTLGLLTWLGTLTDLPIVIKGVLRGDTAEIAARHPSVRGIIVSNHGGRQLDNCIAPLTALPEIVRVVDRVNLERVEQGLEPVEVYVDGGIKRGRDIFKALALGAKAVLLGRPMIYGMAVGGELGVARTVEILRDELKTIMQLAGTQDIDQIDRSFIMRNGTDTSVAPDEIEGEKPFRQ